MSLMHTNDIETKRLILRELTPEIYTQVFTTLSDEQIKEFFGYKTNDELNIERERYHLGLTTFNKSFCKFLLLEKNIKEVIGACGFHTWYLQHARAEIGYGIYDDTNKGKGYMKEALASIVLYGFEHLDLNRIEAFASPENTASVRLLQGLGFQQEGLLREHYCKNNKIEDSVVFSLLKKEYEGNR